ncbi:nucleoside kinase [Megamonas hypermegale]|uniref:nucleoside kinase n=1 Tax=Megamonas hypermegale TaxID=158847 RepID=UPI0025A3E0E7|nr:nucleoside kinase [Megamonas hypermegale]MDM8144216.1 nucleoside kinase [Megamonas hypermegale]
MAQKEQQNRTSLITAAKIDNLLRDLQTDITPASQIEFIDMTQEDGRLAYQRSVLFIMMASVNLLYPDKEVVVEHSVNNGVYCELLPKGDLTAEDVVRIEAKMREFIEKKKDIFKVSLPREDAVALFRESQQIEKSKLIESLKQDIVSLYYCSGYYDYLYGPMLYNTELLDKFALDFYSPGLILRTPLKSNPNEVPPMMKQRKLSMILSEADRWADILKCNYVTNLNDYIKENKSGDIIRISEALHEKKIAQIADHIVEDTQHLRLILIAGPSSSGKTTFAQRLRIQLLVNGLNPTSISLDDYFLDRELTPKNEHGEYDFESLYALDLDLFNKHMLALLNGEAVEIPVYNFTTGYREWKNHIVQVEKNQPIIIEGIHGLNDELTKDIPNNMKYKIYISALTQLAIDGHNRIPTTAARLIRRIVRDNQFRGSHPLKTIRQWSEVRAGENKNIFPYQENADVMFNSALIYELSVLKKYAKPLLTKIDTTLPEYNVSKRLIDFLDYFDDIQNEDDIPNNSILREFIGKSCFF